MQVGYCCVEWSEITKRSGGKAIYDEILYPDYVEDFAVESDLSEGVNWSNSAMQYSETASALSAIRKAMPALDAVLIPICEIIQAEENNDVDQLGVAAASEGCYFISLTPERTKEYAEAFGRVEVASLTEHLPEDAEIVASEFRQELVQWGEALRRAASRGNVAFFGFCG